MTRHFTIALAIVVLVVASAGADTADQPARKLYEEATQHFNLGEYNQAVEKYKEAYREFPNPAFLYNIAQAYRLADQPRQALAFYKSYLNARPDASNANEVDALISELTATIAKLDAAQNARPTAATVPTPAEAAATVPAPPVAVADVDEHEDEPRAVYRRWWFWAGVGVIAVGASALAITRTGESAPPHSDLGNFTAF